MNKRQISWLIVRAFGLYFLIQAFVLLPELLTGLFTALYYTNMMSSVGSEGGNGGSFSRVSTSMYRGLIISPSLRIVLYAAVGLYMLRGGRFLVRLLQQFPDTGPNVNSGDDAQQIAGPEPPPASFSSN